MMFWLQDEAQVLGDLSDEFDPEAGIMRPGLVAIDVRMEDDPYYTTSAWLHVRYENGQLARFRMKKSTAKALYTIMRSVLQRLGEIDYQRMRRGPSEAEFRRQYLGGM